MVQRIAFDLIASTQDEAIRRVREGADAGLLVVARRQHRGRGRLDHSWVSPDGGLYLSVALKEPAFEPGLVPVGVGAGLAGALEETYGIPALVKWPNDLLVPSGAGSTSKLAGVLVDRVLSPSFGVALVVGVGLNASIERSAFPGPLGGQVAILSERVGRRGPPEELEPIVLGAVERTVARLGTEDGPKAVWESCLARLHGIGGRARVDGRPAGIVRGLARDGALLVEQDGALSPVRSGEVEIEEVS